MTEEEIKNRGKAWAFDNGLSEKQLQTAWNNAFNDGVSVVVKLNEGGYTWWKLPPHLLERLVDTYHNTTPSKPNFRYKLTWVGVFRVFRTLNNLIEHGGKLNGFDENTYIHLFSQCTKDEKQHLHEHFGRNLKFMNAIEEGYDLNGSDIE